MMRSSFLLSFLGCCFLLTCRNDDSPEVLRAEVMFVRAKEALARGDYLVSRNSLRELLRLETSLGRSDRRAEAALLLAGNYIEGADFDSAFVLCELARALYTEKTDRGGVRAAVLAQAKAHNACGEDGKAYTLLTEELRVEEALGLNDAVRELKWNLIPIARSIGHTEAERQLLNELDIDAVTRADTLALAKVNLAFGLMLAQRNNSDSARVKFLTAVTFAQCARDPLLAIEALMHGAIASDRMKKQEDAYRYFTEALRHTDSVAHAGRLREEMLLRIATMYIRQGRFAGAKRFLNVALRTAFGTGNKLLEAYVLLQLGHCFAATDPAEARERYESGAALASHAGVPHANAYAQLCLGKFALRQQRLDDALDHFRNAATAEDSVLAQRDGDDVLADCERAVVGSASPYDALIALLVTLGKYDEAFECAERRNNLDVFRVLSGTGITTPNPELNSGLEKFLLARRNYIGAERQLSDAFINRSESLARARNVQRSLMVHSARLRDIGDSLAAFNKQYKSALLLDSPTLADVHRWIPPDAAFVHFVPTERSLYAFVFTNGKLFVEIAAVEHKELVALMNEYREVLGKRSVDAGLPNAASLERRIDELSTQLYGIFLRPIERRLHGSEKLFVVFPPNLPLIPIHALKRFAGSGAYAIEEREIRYVSDAEMLTLKRTPLPGRPAVVAFGNHGRTAVDVDYELKDLKAFARNIQLYINKDASPDALRQSKGDALYFAVDLQFNMKRPDNSFFVLAEGKEYAAAEYRKLGGLFSISPFTTIVVSVLNNQPLHASVPRLFRMGGASDVVMNLYLPMRKAKKMFNELFYTNLMMGVPAETAYRGALLEMVKMKEYKTPHMWAAFSLW